MKEIVNFGRGVETEKWSFLERREWELRRVWEQNLGEGGNGGSHGKDKHTEGIQRNTWRKNREVSHECRKWGWESVFCWEAHPHRVKFTAGLPDEKIGKDCDFSGAVWLDKKYRSYRDTRDDYGGNFQTALEYLLRVESILYHKWNVNNKTTLILFCEHSNCSGIKSVLFMLENLRDLR